MVLDVYQDFSSRIDETLHKVLDMHRNPCTENRLIEIGNYVLSARGKMLRGVMLLEACRAVGGNPEEAIYAAAGTEYGHVASLVHDDLIDQDELRRGQRTVWREYGSDFAILAGDLLIFEAFHSLSLCRHTIDAERVVRVLEVLSKACIDLCLGQALEERLIGNCSARSEDYTEMVRNKTGSLFRAALESGAILGGGTDEQVIAMREYGEYLGIAFQIVDDLLPYTSYDHIMRKPAKSDIRNHRMTLPILYALDSANDVDRHTLQVIFEERKFDDELTAAHDAVTAILHRTGARERANQTAYDFQQQALERLFLLPPNSGRDCLEAISYMAVKRQQ